MGKCGECKWFGETAFGLYDGQCRLATDKDESIEALFDISWRGDGDPDARLEVQRNFGCVCFEAREAVK